MTSTMDGLEKRSMALAFFEEIKKKFPWELTSSVNVVLAKRYFRELVAGKIPKERVEEAVNVLLQKCGIEERIGVHLSLFLHSSHPDAEEMVDEECLSRLAPTCFDSSVSGEDYDWLVSKLGLEPDFLYVVEQTIAPNIETEHVEIIVTDEELLQQIENGDLTVLTTEPLKTRRNDILKLAYRTGLHSRYEKENLSNNLGSLRIRTRSISAMSAAEREALMDEVYLLTFQNPKVAIMALINITVRIKDCVLLHSLKPFMDMAIGSTTVDEHHSEETSLLDYAVFYLILGLDDTSPLWYFYYSGLSILVAEDLIHSSKLLQIVLKVAEEFLKNNNLGNLVNIISLFKHLVIPALEKKDISAEELSKYDNFLNLVQHSTYMTDKSRSILQLRQACILVREFIGKRLDDNINKPAIYSLDERDMRELGLVFVRFPFRRDEVEQHIKQKAKDPKIRTFEGLREVESAISSLINSSCRVEWEGVAKFIQILVNSGIIL